MLRYVSIVAAIALLGTPSVATAQDPTLKKASIQFHTGSDDKDKDTALSVWLSVGTSTIAKKVGFANDNKRFAEKSSSENFELGDVDETLKKSAVKDGVKTRLLMETKDGGDDNWWVKWTITLEWSDGSTTTIKHDKYERYDDDEHTDGTYTDKP